MLHPVSWRKLVRKFRALGFEGPCSGGKHHFMVCGSLTIRIPNPHRGDVSKHLLAEILRQAAIPHDEWEEA